MSPTLFQTDLRITNHQIDVSFLCVCPVIDHELRHNIVKVAVDPQIPLSLAETSDEFQIHVSVRILGVWNGPIQFKSARKIRPLLELLAKIR